MFHFLRHTRRLDGRQWQVERGEERDGNRIWVVDQDLSFYGAACEHSRQINIHDKWKGSFTLVLPALERAWVNLHLRNDSVRTHFRATTQRPCPPIVHTSAPRQSLHLPQILYLLPLSRSPPAPPFLPLYHHYLHSTVLSQSSQLFFTLHLSLPLCIFKHTGAEAGQLLDGRVILRGECTAAPRYALLLLRGFLIFYTGEQEEDGSGLALRWDRRSELNEQLNEIDGEWDAWRTFNLSRAKSGHLGLNPSWWIKAKLSWIQQSWVTRSFHTENVHLCCVAPSVRTKSMAACMCENMCTSWTHAAKTRLTPAVSSSQNAGNIERPRTLICTFYRCEPVCLRVGSVGWEQTRNICCLFWLATGMKMYIKCNPNASDIKSCGSCSGLCGGN